VHREEAREEGSPRTPRASALKKNPQKQSEFSVTRGIQPLLAPCFCGFFFRGPEGPVAALGVPGALGGFHAAFFSVLSVYSVIPFLS